jgi:predicted DNA-binding transcriptional regulator AlpA
MSRKILRPKATLETLGCRKTSFDERYRFHSDDDPFVPGTNIPRLKPIPLGQRNIGYLQHEVDELIDALAELRRDTPKQSTKISTDDAAQPRRR